MKQADKHICPGYHTGEAGGTSPFSSLTFICGGKKWHQKMNETHFFAAQGKE